MEWWMIVGAVLAYAAAFITIAILIVSYRGEQKSSETYRTKIRDCQSEIDELKKHNATQSSTIQDYMSREKIMNMQIKRLEHLERYDTALTSEKAKNQVRYAFLPFVNRFIYIVYNEEEQKLSVGLEVGKKDNMDITIKETLATIQRGIASLQRYDLSYIDIKVETPVYDDYGTLCQMLILHLAYDKPTLRKIRWDFINPDALIKIATEKWHHTEYHEFDKKVYTGEGMDLSELDDDETTDDELDIGETIDE